MADNVRVTVTAQFETLIEEAAERPFTGWDFSWLTGRMTVHPLPWDYTTLLTERARHAPDLLDLGTGGGERLAELAYRPPMTVATESWPPNVPVAAARLRPLGVHVIHNEGAPDNVDQVADERRGALPLRDNAFHLVASRHTAYVPGDLARILVPGGRFLTQQVGYGLAPAFHRLLDLPEPPPPPRRYTFSFAAEQLAMAGLRVIGGDESVQRYEFADVGALVWFLNAVAPWTVPGFTVTAFLPRLEWLHEQLSGCGPISVGHGSFWVEAQRPG
jgi:SAM-dependent methyltransferase